MLNPLTFSSQLQNRRPLLIRIYNRQGKLLQQHKRAIRKFLALIQVADL